MDIWTLLLITIFQFLNTSVAEWDPNSPLVLVQLPNESKMFPFEVRTSSKYKCTVYYNSGNRYSLTTYAYCPDYDDGDRFCNYAETFFTSMFHYDQTPKTRCDLPLEFDMIKIRNLLRQHESCSHNGRIGHLYKFVYWLCNHENDEKKQTVIYEACYQDTEKQIILGSYTIQTPGLLTNPILQDERNYHFDFNTWPYYNHFLDHFRRITVPLFQQSNQYAPRSVLPPEWLPFALQRRPLYHTTNAGAMDASLIRGWKRLMKNLRDRLSKMNEPVNVTAGLLDVLKDEGGNNKYLGKINDKWEIPIPSVWWVLIYNRNNSSGVAIMMHNEPYSTNGGNPNISFYDAQRCSIDVCNSANIGNLLPNNSQYPNNFIYCCQPDVITERFDLTGSNEILVFP